MTGREEAGRGGKGPRYGPTDPHLTSWPLAAGLLTPASQSSCSLGEESVWNAESYELSLPLPTSHGKWDNTCWVSLQVSLLKSDGIGSDKREWASRYIK